MSQAECAKAALWDFLMFRHCKVTFLVFCHAAVLLCGSMAVGTRQSGY